MNLISKKITEKYGKDGVMTERVVEEFYEEEDYLELINPFPFGYPYPCTAPYTNPNEWEITCGSASDIGEYVAECINNNSISTFR